jgi:hypothetical protein
MQCGTLQEEQWMDYITVLRHPFHIESCTVGGPGGPVLHTEDGLFCTRLVEGQKGEI